MPRYLWALVYLVWSCDREFCDNFIPDCFDCWRPVYIYKYICTYWKWMPTYLFIIECTVNNPPIFMHGSAIASLYLADGDILSFHGIIIPFCVSSTEKNTRTNHQQCQTSPQLPLDHCWQHLATFESFHRVETPPTGPEITQI